MKYLIWGIRHHPGNVLYMALYVACAFNFLDGAWLAFAFILILHIVTSVSVGKANKHLVNEPKKEPKP